MLVVSTPGVALCPVEALGMRQSEGYIISLTTWATWMCRGKATVRP